MPQWDLNYKLWNHILIMLRLIKTHPKRRTAPPTQGETKLHKVIGEVNFFLRPRLGS